MEKQYYYLMALFDEPTNKKFYSMKQVIESSLDEPPVFLPHLTLGAYMNVDETELCEWVDQRCKRLHQIELNFNHLGLFALKVLFIAPQPSNGLVNMHQIIHERYDNDYGEIGYNYTIQSNNWVPHVTLLMSSEPNVVLDTLPIVDKLFVPFVGKVCSLALYEYHSMRRIKIFPLSCLKKSVKQLT